LLFKHALLRSQSELITHSGLQPVYGSPKYSGRHTQEPAPLRSLHTALAPHGDGLHGFLGPSVGVGAGKIKLVILPYLTGIMFTVVLKIIFTYTVSLKVNNVLSYKIQKYVLRNNRT